MLPDIATVSKQSTVPSFALQIQDTCTVTRIIKPAIKYINFKISSYNRNSGYKIIIITFETANTVAKIQSQPQPRFSEISQPIHHCNTYSLQ